MTTTMDKTFKEKLEDFRFHSLRQDEEDDERKEEKIIQALCFSISYQHYCLKLMPIGWITLRVNPYFLKQYKALRPRFGTLKILGLQVVAAWMVPVAFECKRSNGNLPPLSVIIMGSWVPLFTFISFGIAKFVGVYVMDGAWQTWLHIWIMRIGKSTIPSAFFCGIGDFCLKQSEAAVFRKFEEKRTIIFEPGKQDWLGPADHVIIMLSLSICSFFYFALSGGLVGFTLALSFGPILLKATDMLYRTLYDVEPIIEAVLDNYKAAREWWKPITGVHGQDVPRHMADACRDLAQEYKEWGTHRDGLAPDETELPSRRVRRPALSRMHNIATAIDSEGPALLKKMFDYLRHAHQKDQTQLANVCCRELWRASTQFATSKVGLYVLGLIDIRAFLTAYFDPQGLAPYMNGKKVGREFLLKAIVICPLPAVICKFNRKRWCLHRRSRLEEEEEETEWTHAPWVIHT